MVKIVENITELVGNSPIIKLKNGPENGAEIYLKREYFNPGGSVKDRIALQMIRQAEADGRLKKGGTIVEPTSGNTGIGLAMAGAALGYNVVIIMPDSYSKERRQLIQAYGAELILTPAADGIKAAIDLGQKLVEENGGRNLSAVSKNLNYLIAGENAGSKVKKAEDLGSVTIITEEEFLNLINL